MLGIGGNLHLLWPRLARSTCRGISRWRKSRPGCIRCENSDRWWCPISLSDYSLSSERLDVCPEFELVVHLTWQILVVDGGSTFSFLCMTLITERLVSDNRQLLHPLHRATGPLGDSGVFIPSPFCQLDCWFPFNSTPLPRVLTSTTTADS